MSTFKQINDELAERVTNDIVSALERGTPPWVRPWRSSGQGMPSNLVTGQSYKGANATWLLCFGTGDNRWCTRRQAEEKGWTVREGAMAASIVVWKTMGKRPKATTEDGEEQEVRHGVRFGKAYAVYNAKDIEGRPADPETTPVEPTPIRLWAARTGAHIAHGCGRDKAFYAIDSDCIYMPFQQQFESDAAFDATLLHELVHWTGHKNRRNRVFGKRFGDGAYAFEELIAEIGSAILCAHLGVDGRLQHAEYVGSWVAQLRGDKYAVFTASRLAFEAANYLIEAAEGRQNQEAA